MARRHWLWAPLLVVGCSSPSTSTGSPQPEPVYYEGNTGGCIKVEQVCLSTDPPQCFDYCADAPPKSGSACSGKGDVQECGGLSCVVGKDDSGKEAEVCVSLNCTISYQASSGKEAISCPSTDGGLGDGGPGFADGSSPADQ